MYLNSEASIELGRQVHQKYGSWEEARRAGAAVTIDIGAARAKKSAKARKSA